MTHRNPEDMKKKVDVRGECGGSRTALSAVVLAHFVRCGLLAPIAFANTLNPAAP